MQEQSNHLAEYSVRMGAGLVDTMRVAIERAYSRPANDEEIQRAVKRISALREKFGLSEQQAFREYCLVLLNSNEFIYLD